VYLLFERNFAKKVKTYYYDWQSPTPLRELLWECFRLIYIWFFLILFGLIIWGFVVLDGESLWPVGFLLFLLPTIWEIFSLFTWRGFKYQPLQLEDEPDIATLWPGGSEVKPSGTRGGNTTDKPWNG